MNSKQKNTVLAKWVKVGLFGGLSAILLAFILSAVAALLIDRGTLGQKYEPVIAVLVRAVPFFLSAMLVVLIVKEKKLQTAGVMLGTGLLLMVGMTILLWDGVFIDMFAGVIECVVAAAGGVLVAMLPRKKKSAVGAKYR